MFAIDKQPATMEQIEFISSDKVVRAELYFLNDQCYDADALKMFKPNQVVQFDQSDETTDQSRNAQMIRRYTVNVNQKQIR